MGCSSSDLFSLHKCLLPYSAVYCIIMISCLKFANEKQYITIPTAEVCYNSYPPTKVFSTLSTTLYPIKVERVLERNQLSIHIAVHVVLLSE